MNILYIDLDMFLSFHETIIYVWKIIVKLK